MKGAMLYKKHYSILQNMMMDGVCDAISEGKYIDLSKNTKSIENELDKLDVDYLFVWYFKEEIEKLKPLSRLEIPIIMTSDDSWGRLFNNDFKNQVDYHGVDGIVLQTKCTKDAFDEYLGGTHNFLWLPWGIDPNIMKDYKEKKIWDFSISGKFSQYKYRRELHNIFSNKNNYHRIPRLLPPSRSWKDYAIDINKSKISLGGCSQSDSTLYYNNHFIGETFAKTLEIPACNTCMININFADKEQLRFKDGVNFIQFNNLKEFFKKIDYYLNDKDELERITKNGYNLVKANYTVGKQINKLMKQMENIYG